MEATLAGIKVTRDLRSCRTACCAEGRTCRLFFTRWKMCGWCVHLGYRPEHGSRRPGSASTDRWEVAAVAEQLAGTPLTPASTVGEDLSEVAALLNGLAPRRSGSS